MEVIPAIDLRGGRVVRLYQGDFAKETAYAQDAVAVARSFEEAGAHRLHVVDLDGAAKGEPVHLELCARIVRSVGIPVQLGGGLRTIGAIHQAFAAGVVRVVLGTAAAMDQEVAQEAMARFGTQRVAIALDARDGLVATQGWTATTSVSAEAMLERLAEVGVRRFIYTDIARDGTLSGPNYAAVATMVRKATEYGAVIIASGGVSSVEHLQRLAAIGVEAAILGSALYTGRLSFAQALAAVAYESY